MRSRGKLCFFVSAVFLSAMVIGGVDGYAQVKLPQTMNLATHPIGSFVNAMGSGLSTVMSKNLKTVVKVMPTTGPTEWLPMVASGEVDMGVLNNYDAQMGRLGKEDYNAATAGKGSPIYLLCSGTPANGGVLVADKSGIMKGADLKGKRVVAVYTGSAGITAQGRAVLANLGLEPTDVKIISVPGVEGGVRALIEGKADANASTNIGMAATAELDAQSGARYISLDPSPDAVKKMQQYYPCYLVQVKPGPGMVGVKEPVWMMAYDFFLVAAEKMSEEVAYQMVKCLWEHDQELGAIHVRLKDWTKDRFVTTKATVPYHPGAVKFYKEMGVWTEEMAKLQQTLLAQKPGK
jgi:uncharacterized protein